MTRELSVTKGQKLRLLLKEQELLIAPAVYDCISAKVAQQCGFQMAFTSGFGLSASLLGKPDLGLLTATEIIERVRYMAKAIDIPLIADMDTGYGGVLNVIRTVEDVVAAGAGGIILEDQVWPKRCGHFEKKSIVSVKEHTQKIKAAVDARADSGLVIVARTDAIAVDGLENAIERGKRYLDAGADILFVEAPENIEQIERIAEVFDGVPLFANMIEGGKTPLLNREQLLKYGFKVCAYALTGLFAAAQAMQESFAALRREGVSHSQQGGMDFEQFKGLIGLKDDLDILDRYES